MSLTAFFQSKKAELSLAQYLHDYGIHYSNTLELTELSEELRQRISNDAKCPICGCVGAVFVAASRGVNKSQAHLKFIDSNGKNAHAEICDFADPNENLRVLKTFEQTEKSSGSALTRQIDQLVSKAIQNDLISQSDIIGFRKWILDGIPTTAPTFTVSATNTRAFMTLVYKVTVARSPFYNPTTKKARENLAIDKAVSKEIENRHPSLMAAVLRSRGKIRSNKSEQGIREYQSKSQNIKRPNSDYLTGAWDATSLLIGKIINAYQSLKIVDMRDRRFFEGFACFLLYVNNWDLNLTLNFLDKINHLPDSELPIHGCVIGINPFGYYLVDSMLTEINHHQQVIDSIPNFHELWQTLRNTY